MPSTGDRKQTFDRLRRSRHSGSGADLSFSNVATQLLKLAAVFIKLGTVATTPANITITRTSSLGIEYDTRLMVDDPSNGGTVDYVYWPDADCHLERGDGVTVSYSNPDGVTMSVEIVLKES